MRAASSRSCSAMPLARSSRRSIQGLMSLSNGSGRRTAESFEGGAPPVLHIEYQTQPPAPPANETPPTVAGDTHVGRTLTAERGAWAGDAPIAYAYQWQRCDAAGDGCADLVGKNDGSYVLGLGDVGATIRVRVRATNNSGSASATSPPCPKTSPTA